MRFWVKCQTLISWARNEQQFHVNLIWNSQRESERYYISLGFIPGGAPAAHDIERPLGQ